MELQLLLGVGPIHETGAAVKGFIGCDQGVRWNGVSRVAYWGFTIGRNPYVEPLGFRECVLR